MPNCRVFSINSSNCCSTASNRSALSAILKKKYGFPVFSRPHFYYFRYILLFIIVFSIVIGITKLYLKEIFFKLEKENNFTGWTILKRNKYLFSNYAKCAFATFTVILGYFHFRLINQSPFQIMQSLKLLQTLTQCNSTRTVLFTGRICAVDALNRKRYTLKPYSTQNQRESRKGGRDDSESKTGTELDVKRKSPYEGLSAGQKGKHFSHDIYVLIIILNVHNYTLLAPFYI